MRRPAPTRRSSARSWAPRGRRRCSTCRCASPPTRGLRSTASPRAGSHRCRPRVRQGRPVGPAAIHRSDQRPELLALLRLRAALRLRPFFRERFATRQDLNLGVNKTYNFNGNFQRVAFSPDTLADTIWSFGVTAFAQRRFRDPEPSSWAFPYPLGDLRHLRAIEREPGRRADVPPVRPLPGLQRARVVPGTDRDAGVRAARRLVRLRAATPTLFGAAGHRPADGLRAATGPTFRPSSYSAWHVGAALKLGWRF